MSDVKGLLTDWRMLILFGFLIISLVFIAPRYVLGSDGTMEMKTSVKQGLDLRGGARALLLPADNTRDIADQIVSKLSVRVNAMGLTETKVYSTKDITGTWYVQVEMAGMTEEGIRQILSQQGKFESKINRLVSLSEGQGTLRVNGKDHSVSVDESGAVSVDGAALPANKTFEVEGVPFEYLNSTEKASLFAARVYTGNDVLKVFKGQEQITKVSQGTYQFSFSLMLGKDGAGRFAKVTKDVPLSAVDRGYLDANIDLYLDDKLMDTLRIGDGLRGQAETTISISGPGESREDAVAKMKNLEAILESGALPTTVQVVKIDSVSPTLGSEFMRTTVNAIIFAMLAIGAIIFAKYRDIKIVIPVMFTCASEVVIIFGFAAWTGWTIDLSSIAGIMASVGGGVNHQIIITDESGKKKIIESLKTKLKNAFSIIFGAAFTTIAAMVPLLSVGAGGVKGFALTTIVGITIGIAITRPAYARIIEFIREEA